MTQRPPAKKFVPPPPVGLLPTPGMVVRVKGHPETGSGVVREHDDWWDSLLLRGVDIADQVLVDWTAAGSAPVVRWERIAMLEQVPAKDTPEPDAS